MKPGQIVRGRIQSKSTIPAGQGAVEFSSSTRIWIKFDYPLNCAVTRSFYSKNGFSCQMVLNRIRKTYSEIFRSPAKYGVYGHGIGDLFLEGVRRVRKPSRFVLDVSS
jgi:hypothetical protein